MQRLAGTTAIALLLVAISGCKTWPWARVPQAPASPQLFTAKPELADLIGAVNANTDRVSQLQANSVVLTITGAPTLRGNLKYERPRNFRLKAGLTQLTGSEVDIGSNNEMFWVWMKRMDAIYYARHAEFAASPASDAVPLEPNWLVEAIGLPRFDPGDRHEGPIERGDNKYEIRSYLSGADRGKTKVTLIDGSYGWVLQQNMYDSNNQLTASATATGHRYYPDAGVVLPATVEIQLPKDQQTARIDVAEYVVNQLQGDPQQLWAMPQTDARAIDLSQLAPANTNSGDATLGTPFTQSDFDSSRPRPMERFMENHPRIGFRPKYRGYE